MKKLLFILLLGICFSQTYEHIVILKNGNEVYGVIIEHKPYEYVIIESGTDVFVLKMEEIERIEKIISDAKIINSENNIYHLNSFMGLSFGKDSFGFEIYHRIKNNWGGIIDYSKSEETEEQTTYNTTINKLLITYDIPNTSDLFTRQIIVGAGFMKQTWENADWNVSDTFNNTSPIIGGGIYMHINKNVSIGLLPLMGQNITYNMSSNGNTEILDRKWGIFYQYYLLFNF